MINFLKKTLKNNKGMILLTLMLISMLLLSLGLGMLYQADSNLQLSSHERNKIETFMTAETAYESCVSRIIYCMDALGYEDNFATARPGNNSGWSNYLMRVYDDYSNPNKFRLVELPSIDFYEDADLNRDISAATEVTDDNNNADFYLITRDDSLSGGTVFKVDDTHYYRAWFEADRYQDDSPDDHTALLMIEAFKGKPGTSINPNDPNFIPQEHTLMQYRIKLLKYTTTSETGDTSQYGEGAAGTGSTYSTGDVDISSEEGSRSITEKTE
jgi:hypothetical protein